MEDWDEHEQPEQRQESQEDYADYSDDEFNKEIDAFAAISEEKYFKEIKWLESFVGDEDEDTASTESSDGEDEDTASPPKSCISSNSAPSTAKESPKILDMHFESVIKGDPIFANVCPETFVSQSRAKKLAKLERKRAKFMKEYEARVLVEGPPIPWGRPNMANKYHREDVAEAITLTTLADKMKAELKVDDDGEPIEPTLAEMKAKLQFYNDGEPIEPEMMEAMLKFYNDEEPIIVQREVKKDIVRFTCPKMHFVPMMKKRFRSYENMHFSYIEAGQTYIFKVLEVVSPALIYLEYVSETSDDFNEKFQSFYNDSVNRHFYRCKTLPEIDRWYAFKEDGDTEWHRVKVLSADSLLNIATVVLTDQRQTTTVWIDEIYELSPLFLQVGAKALQGCLHGIKPRLPRERISAVPPAPGAAAVPAVWPEEVCDELRELIQGKKFHMNVARRQLYPAPDNSPFDMELRLSVALLLFDEETKIFQNLSRVMVSEWMADAIPPPK